MNETYKKVDDLAHYVSQHAEKHPEMATLIIASPDVEAENGKTLCAMTGTGANLIEMLATALEDNDNLLKFVKDAVALVEGARVMGRLAKARQMQHEEERGKKESGCDNEQPTCTAACDSDEEMGACDADNRNREYDVNENSCAGKAPNVEE
jgi:hypothetical protein